MQLQLQLRRFHLKNNPKMASYLLLSGLFRVTHILAFFDLKPWLFFLIRSFFKTLPTPKNPDFWEMQPDFEAPLAVVTPTYLK